MKTQTAILKAVANDHRSRYLELLSKKEMAVFELATAERLTFRTASKHLQRMESVGLIRRTQSGKFANYSATELGRKVLGMLDSINTFVRTLSYCIAYPKQ